MAELKPSRQARRSFLKLAGAGLSLVLTACQIVPAAGPAAPSAPPVVAAGEPQRSPAAQSRPQPERQLINKVAVLVPLSGPNSGVGTSIANAAKMALADARGDRLQLQVYDTARGAQAAAERALADGNRLFLGPLLAEDVRQIAPVARRSGVPLVSFSNDVTVAGNGVYVMGFNPGQSIERVVRYARSQGLQRFAGLIPEGEYGDRSGEAFRRAVELAGGRLVATQSYGRSPAELRSAAIRLNAQTPFDAVLIADNGQIAMSAAATIRSGPSREARILGTELWKPETALVGSASMRGAWFASVPDGLFDQFRTRYRTRYSAAPSRLASLGYDAVLLAVRISAQWQPGQPFPEGALRSPTGFDGLDGAYRFGPYGISERQLDVIQVNAGGFSVISPAEAAFR